MTLWFYSLLFWLLGEAFHAAYSSSVSSRILILGDIHMQRWNVLHTHFLSNRENVSMRDRYYNTHIVSPSQLLFRIFLRVKIWNRTVIPEQDVTDGVFFPSLGVINDDLHRRYREIESKDIKFSSTKKSTSIRGLQCPEHPRSSSSDFPLLLLLSCDISL